MLELTHAPSVGGAQYKSIVVNSVQYVDIIIGDERDIIILHLLFLYPKSRHYRSLEVLGHALLRLKVDNIIFACTIMHLIIFTAIAFGAIIHYKK